MKPAPESQPTKPLRKSAPYPPFRRSIIMDKVNPQDFRELNLVYACEQCIYYSAKKHQCAMGFKIDLHLKENQLKLYELTGRMAICRAQEVD